MMKMTISMKTIMIGINNDAAKDRRARLSRRSFSALVLALWVTM